MTTKHALVLVAAVAIAAVAGTYAAMRTARLSVAAAQPARVSRATIARQNRALDRAQAALRAELKRKPPALPAVPTPARVAAPAAGPVAAASTAAAPVIYVRPKPIVRVIHRHGEADHERDGGDRGAGLDD